MRVARLVGIVSQISQQISEMQREGRKVARRAAGWIEPVARVGYAAKGVVYCLIGVIAVMAAVGMRERVADQRGVMKAILAQPFGKVMLLAMAVGLSCYTLWYFIQAILDPEGAGHDLKGAAKRVGRDEGPLRAGALDRAKMSELGDEWIHATSLRRLTELLSRAPCQSREHRTSHCDDGRPQWCVSFGTLREDTW